MSVYLFPGERSGAQPPSSPVGVPAGSLGSFSETHEDETEEDGDGDTLDSDEFCILDAPGLGVPVCGGQEMVGDGGSVSDLLEMELWERQEVVTFCWELGLGGSSWGGSPDSGLQRS